MDLTIVIINYNSKKVIHECLNSIVKSNYSFTYELFVVDNNSTEPINDLVGEFPQFQFIFNESNNGFAFGNNIAIKISNGRNILLLNPDTIVNSSSFYNLIQFLDQHSDVGVVGCKIFNLNGEIEKSTHSFPSLLKEFIHANEYLKPFIGYGSLLSKVVYKISKSRALESYWDHNSIKEVDHVTGACMMIKREVIEKVGLLDEAFFLYNEEVEWSLRIKKAGYKIVFLPDTSIIHLFGYSTKQKVQKQTINRLLVERYRGMLYFFDKHYGKRKLLILKIIILEGFLIRLMWNYLISMLVFKKKNKYINNTIYIKKIIKLVYSKNYDWRSSK